MEATAQQPDQGHGPTPADRIAHLNDKLRTTGTGGQILITRGVQDLIGCNVSQLLETLAAFDEFNLENDPYGEHDFGLFDFQGAEIMWKIDYYSKADLRFASDDPANSQVTERVLTLLLADEY